MSFETLSTGWFVCWAMISSRRRLRLIVSFAWISISVPWPWKPPDTWWIRILEFGSAVRRTALPNSKILIHQVSGGFQGQGTDIEIQAKETINLKRRLEEIIAQHTNQPVDKVSKDMERDYYMTSEEAEQYGIVDQVIAHR